MKRRIFIYVPGILNWPGAHDNWTGRAVTWTNKRNERSPVTALYCGEDMDYLALVFTRALWHRARVARLARMLEFYPQSEWEITLVGHSNGTHIITDLFLMGYPVPHITRSVLVCGAVAANFQANGLNAAMADGRLGGVDVWCAGKDFALALAHTVVGRVCGYGTLGRDGPLGILASNRARVRRFDWPAYGHSECWTDENFEQTMHRLVEGGR